MYRELVEAIESLNIDPDEIPRLGIIGGEDDNGNYAINVIDEPNKVYVQFIDGLGQPQTEAVNYGVPLIPEFPVLVYYRNKEAYAVIDPDRAIYFRSQNEGLGNVAPHSHEPGLGNFDLVSTRRMKEGIVTVTLPYSMSVDVEGFKFLNPITGEERWFPGGSLNLAGYVPGTTNTHRWVKVGFDPFIEELVAASGVEYPSPVPLSEEQLAEIEFANKQSLAGIELYNSVTAIDDDKIIHDWRFFLNTIVTGVGGGGASGGTVDELADLSDVLSASQTANFILAAGDGSTGGEYRGRLLVDADIPQLNASHIDAGTFDTARIPDLDAAKITSGTFDTARIPNLDASKITTGTLALARGGMAADVSAFEGVLRIFSGTTGAIRYKFDTVNPTANDDTLDGYVVGSRWVNTTTGQEYVCVDNSSAAAVWAETTGGQSLTVEEQDASPSVASVIKIKFPNASVTDEGSGVVSVAFTSTTPAFCGAKFNSNGTAPLVDAADGQVEIDFNATDFDSDTFYGGGDPRFLTVPSGKNGIYTIHVDGYAIDDGGNLEADVGHSIIIWKNKDTTPVQLFVYNFLTDYSSGAQEFTYSIDTIHELAVGDTISLAVLNSGTNETLYDQITLTLIFEGPL